MKNRVLTVGSLFSGIGGFDLAARWMKWETRWMVENNPYCRGVLRRHFPDARLYRDVRKVDFANVEPVDVLVGGFPCQRHSSVNSRRQRISKHDEEVFLWPYFAHAIRMVKPRYAVVENVSNIIRDGTLAIILKDLAACGYDAEWDIVSARAVGALHLRERAWVIAYPSGFGVERPRARKRARKAEKNWKDYTRPLRTFAKTPFTRRHGVPEPLLRDLADGFPAQVARLKAIGNAVVPQVVLNYPYRQINRMDRFHQRRLLRQEK